MLELHPDRNPSPSAREEFLLVVAAYTRLKELEPVGQDSKLAAVGPHEIAVSQPVLNRYGQVPYWQLGLPVAILIAVALGLATYPAALRSFLGKQANPYGFLSDYRNSNEGPVDQEYKDYAIRESLALAIGAAFMGGTFVILAVAFLANSRLRPRSRRRRRRGFGG